MFNTGNWKQKASFMALGSIFTIIGMLFAIGILPSVKAQKDKLVDIECTSLTVADTATGEKVIIRGGLLTVQSKDNDVLAAFGIDEHGGRVETKSKDGSSLAVLGTNEWGGRVDVFGKGLSLAGLSINEHGGRVEAWGAWSKNGANSKAVLGNDEYGGVIKALGKDGFSEAWLGFNEHGGRVAVGVDPKVMAEFGVDRRGGYVAAYSKYGKSGLAGLRINEHGGLVTAYGKSLKARAGLGINEYGNGAVYTWDKNGNRQ